MIVRRSTERNLRSDHDVEKSRRISATRPAGPRAGGRCKGCTRSRRTPQSRCRVRQHGGPGREAIEAQAGDRPHALTPESVRGGGKRRLCGKAAPRSGRAAPVAGDLARHSVLRRRRRRLLADADMSAGMASCQGQQADRDGKCDASERHGRSPKPCVVPRENRGIRRQFQENAGPFPRKRRTFCGDKTVRRGTLQNTRERLALPAERPCDSRVFQLSRHGRFTRPVRPVMEVQS